MVKEKVVEIISDISCIKKENITMKSKFVDDLGCSSIDLADIIFACEEEFGVTIDDDELCTIATVQDCIDIIYRKKN